MKKALQQAQDAFDADEVPVGAIIVCNGQVIATGHNQTERLTDVTAHAEMIALTAAQEYLGAKFLEECEMYVTLEPCPMCAGAIAWARIGKLHIAAQDKKRGYSNYSPNLLHPKTEVHFGEMAEEGAALMRSFFEKKR